MAKELGPEHLDLVRAIEFLAFKFRVQNSPETEPEVSCRMHDTGAYVFFNAEMNSAAAKTVVVNLTLLDPFDRTEWLEYVLDNVFKAFVTPSPIFNHRTGDYVVDVGVDGRGIYLNRYARYEDEIRFALGRPSEKRDESEEKNSLDAKISSNTGTAKNMEELASQIDGANWNPPAGFSEAEWDLEELSPLKLLGYTVGSRGKPHKDRIQFLTRFLFIELPETVKEPYRSSWGTPGTETRLRKVMNHIQANISRFSDNDPVKYSDAIADWEKDWNYLDSIKDVFKPEFQLSPPPPDDELLNEIPF